MRTRGRGRRPVRGAGGVHRRASAAALAVAGLVLAGAGVAVLVSPPALRVAVATPASGTEARAVAPPAPGAPVDPRPEPSPGGPGAPAPATAAPGAVAVPGAVAAPTQLSVPDLGVTADVVPVGVDGDGALEVPADPRVAGWWSSGAVPASQGSTVIAAHVDAVGIGPGPLAAVLRAPVGTAIQVATEGGAAARYTVAEIRSYPKSDGLPAELFAVGGPARLVLITCSGTFRNGHYADNAVVIATPR